MLIFAAAILLISVSLEIYSTYFDRFILEIFAKCLSMRFCDTSYAAKYRGNANKIMCVAPAVHRLGAMCSFDAFFSECYELYQVRYIVNELPH